MPHKRRLRPSYAAFKREKNISKQQVLLLQSFFSQAALPGVCVADCLDVEASAVAVLRAAAIYGNLRLGRVPPKKCRNHKPIINKQILPLPT